MNARASRCWNPSRGCIPYLYHRPALRQQPSNIETTPQDAASNQCALARAAACSAGDVTCGALAPGGAAAATPLETAYLAALQLLAGGPGGRGAGCRADVLLVSLLFEGVLASDLDANYANATAGVISSIIASKSANDSSAGGVTWSVVPVAAAPGPTAGHRRRRALRGLPAAPAALTLALFAVPVADRAAAAAAVRTAADGDGGFALYSALRLAGVPFRPRALTVDGRRLSSVAADTPVSIWAVAGRPDAPPTPLARNDPVAAQSGRRLPTEAVVGAVLGSALGVAAAALAGCGACVALRRRRRGAGAPAAPKSDCSDSGARVAGDGGSVRDGDDDNDDSAAGSCYLDVSLHRGTAAEFDYGQTLREK